MQEMLSIIPGSLWFMWAYMTIVCVGPVFIGYYIQHKIDRRDKK